MHGRFSKFEPDNTQMTGVYLKCTYTCTYSRSQITSHHITSSYNNRYTDTNIQKKRQWNQPIYFTKHVQSERLLSNFAAKGTSLNQTVQGGRQRGNCTIIL